MRVDDVAGDIYLPPPLRSLPLDLDRFHLCHQPPDRAWQRGGYLKSWYRHRMIGASVRCSQIKALKPGRRCSLRHRMPIKSRNEGLKYVSMMRRATFACPWGSPRNRMPFDSRWESSNCVVNELTWRATCALISTSKYPAGRACRARLRERRPPPPAPPPRGLQSSTSQLNLSRFWSPKPQQSSTSQLNLKRFCRCDL
jgi:hypothetical protein